MSSPINVLKVAPRIPLSEPEELANAVLAKGGKRDVALGRWLAVAYLPLLGLGYVLLAVGTIAGWTIVAGAAWLVLVVVDWAAMREAVPATRLLGAAGVSPRYRALARDALLAIVVAGASPGWSIAILVCLIAAVHAAWLVASALAVVVARNAPPLRYIPGGNTPALTQSYARFYQRGFGIPTALVGALVLGAVAVLGSAVGVIAPLAGQLGGVAAGVAVVAWAARTALQARRILSDARTVRGTVENQLAASAPELIVYASLGAGQAGYIVNQWTPVFDRLAARGLLVVREASQLTRLAPTNLEVIYAPEPRDVESVTVDSVRAAFYLAHGGRNSHLLRDRRLRHVLLMHGESDKGSSSSPLAKAYDEVWVAGPIAAERFAASGIQLAPDQIAVIGRPQVEELGVGRRGGSERTVLYAPTFEGYSERENYSSLETMGPRLIDGLLTGQPDVTILFKPHPSTGIQRPGMLAAMRQVEDLLLSAPGQHQVLGSDVPINTGLARADLLLTDVSSVAADFLYTERPAIITNPLGLPDEAVRHRYPTLQGSYLVGPDLVGFSQALQAAFGDDPLLKERQQAKRRVLGDLPQGPFVAFNENVQRVLAGTRDQTGSGTR